MAKDNRTRRMNSDLIVDFPCRQQLASSAKSKTKTKKSKVRFSKTSRLYIITRVTPEEAPRVWNSSKEIADIKRHFIMTVRKTWQMLNDTEVSTQLTIIAAYLFITSLMHLSYWLYNTDMLLPPNTNINNTDTPGR